MKNPFSLEKGMEILEQGGNTAKQQVKSAAQQVTGQQPDPQNQQQPKLNSLKSQILGNGGSEGQKLDTVKSQLTGIMDFPKKPNPIGQAPLSPNTKQEQDAKFTNELYGLPDDPDKYQKMQQTLDPDQLNQKKQNDLTKQADIKKHLEMYYKPEFEQKPEQLRRQEEQQKMQEEHVDEQQKMQELQVEEKKKDDDIALRRVITKTEVKVGGG